MRSLISGGRVTDALNMGLKTFLIVPADEAILSLRRFVYSDKSKCPGYFMHNASVEIGRMSWPHNYTGAGWLVDHPSEYGPTITKADPRWPKKCDHCDYAFADTDEWQPNADQLWERTDTKARFTLREAPPGAMWDATWYHDMPQWCGPDGHCYVVKCPNGADWNIDSRANNCDSPCKNCGQPYHAHNAAGFPCKTYEDARPHKCWVRHGTAPVLHVDKNGVTCGAGAGSIVARDFHGFLHNGEFTNC